MFNLKTLLTTILLSFYFSSVLAEETTTIIAPTSEVAEGLDLYAVSELFKESENLEDFEAELNNPTYGLNNLDLDGNGQVDFIRVVEEIIGDTHIVILQAIIWEDELQDVATIEIETSDNNYDMHVQGNEVIYGANYYIAPTHVHINTWPIITWISRPVYRPYRSVYYWNSYPHWWKPYRPLLKRNYYLRTHKYKKRNTFVVTRTARVKQVTRVNYKPKTSVRVTRHVGVKATNNKVNRSHTKVTKTTRKKAAVKQNSQPIKKKQVKRTTTKKAVSKKPNNKNSKNAKGQKVTTEKKSKKSVRERK